MQTAPFYIEADDGVRLGCVTHAARGAARGVLLLSHAMMADSRTLDRPAGKGLASLLADHGYQVYRLDVRDHGLSRRGRPDWAYRDVYGSDLPAAVEAIHRRHPELPLGFVGHSLTAHGSLMMLGRRPELPVRAVVALAANVWLPRWEPSPARWLVKRLLLESWGIVTRSLGYFPARRLRMGPADVSLGFVSDVLRSARRGRLLDAEGDLVAGLARVPCPVLMVAGEQDLMAPPREVARLGSALPAQRVDHWSVPGGHMALVTSQRSRPTWERLVGWLDARLLGQPLLSSRFRVDS